MPVTEIYGSSMYYLDRGQGIPIVLLHGYLGNAFMWAPQISAFEDDFRLIAPDIWGHGNSGDLPAGTSNLTHVAQQLMSLLDNLAVEKFILIGHSVGGMLAGEIAIQVPDKVIALALIDTHLGEEPSQKKEYFLNLISSLEDHQKFTPNLIEELQGLFFSSRNTDISARLKTALNKDLSARTQHEIIKSLIPLGRMIFNRRDMTANYSLINAASTIVLCGEYDVVRTPAESLEMSAKIGCHYVEVPSVAHTPNLEDSKFVTEILSRFICQVVRLNSQF